MLVRRLVAILPLIVCLACGAGTPGARVRSPSEARASLEAELASLPASTDTGNTLRRAHLLRALGRQQEARDALGAAIDAARDRVDFDALSALWRELGDVDLEMGRPQEALEPWSKRLENAVKRSQREPRVQSLVDTAWAFALLGSMLRADEALSDALLLGGDDATGDPLTLERVALVSERLDDSDRAEAYFAKAEQAWASRGDDAGAARAAVFAAGLRARDAKSAAPLAAVKDRAEGALDPEPRARLARFAAEAALAAHDHAQCAARAKEAVALADKRGLEPLGKTARVLLARCAGEAGTKAEIDQAIAAAEEAAAIAEEERAAVTGDQAREQIGFEAFEIYRLLLSLQLRLPDGPARTAAAFLTMEKARGRAHVDALARGRGQGEIAAATIDPALAASEAEATERVRALTKELVAARGDPGVADRHRDALWALEDIKETIEENNPLLGRVSIPPPATLADVRETLLDDRAMLVTYFLTEERSIALAITKTDARLAVLSAPPAQLGAMVRDYRAGVLLDPSKPAAEAKRAAAALYEAVLGPFDDLVRTHARLIVAPHGHLAALPFEALAGKDGKWIVETHDVAYAVSATLAVELARAPAGKKGRRAFVGMGDPVYDWAAFQAGKPEGVPADGAIASRGFVLYVGHGKALGDDAGSKEPEGNGLDRLPGTADEVRAIARLFGADQKIYLRDQASEEAVKGGAFEGTRIVHVASHGLLEPHYQALALTLNPSAKEDGFLLASEIADLKLDADLVVLSACDTGRTQLRAAEPVAGLALALRTAGARDVVVSLWQVDDAATARLMVDFYQPLVQEGADYAKALADAKRKMIASPNAAPYFWAPFVLIGG